MFEPVEARFVQHPIDAWWPARPRGEVVQDHNTTRAQPFGRIQWRFVAFTLTAAIKHQQVKRCILCQLTPVTAADLHTRLIGEHLPGLLRSTLVTFDADQSRPGMSRAGQPS